MATTFDVVSDFNDSGVQPAAGYPFTYGTETALNVGFTLLPYFGNTNASVAGGVSQNDGTVDNWYFQQPLQFSGPSVGVVATGGTLTFPSLPPLVISDDELVMSPGSPDHNAPDLIVTRFTAPSAGLFDLAGSFTDLQAASVGLTILVNGDIVFSNSSFTGSSVYQGTISFSLNGMSLAQGATIDFVVDSLGQQAYDVLGLRALITETNAAPSLALANTTTSLAEGSYANHVKVADITITDDGVGTNKLTLSGADAALFEFFDGDLYLKAGTVLDFEGALNLSLSLRNGSGRPSMGDPR